MSVAKPLAIGQCNRGKIPNGQVTDDSWEFPLDDSELDRWPHLARPGPQPHNQIPATAAEALALAKSKRTPEPLPAAETGRILATLKHHSAEVKPVLLSLVAEDIGVIAAAVAREVLKQRSKGARRRHAVKR